MNGSRSDAVLAPFRAAYADPVAAARDHRRDGGRVIGYIGDGVPTELIAAAGFLPYRLSGGGSVQLPFVERYLYPAFQKPAQERNIFLREIEAIVEAILDGRFAAIEHLVIPYTRKEIAQVHGQLRAVANAFPTLDLPLVTILDRTMSSSYHASEYNRASLVRFRRWLEAVAGAPVSDDRLTEEIRAANRQRALLHEVAALRTAPEPRLSGSDALAILASAQWLPRAHHVAALERLLDARDELEIVGGTPVFVGGSSLDTARFYRRLEQLGIHVCGENHDWGQRTAEDLIDEGLPPFDGVAERFHKHAPGFSYPLARSANACAERATRCGATAAILRITEGDMMAIFEAPSEQTALRAHHIPAAVLAGQSYGDAPPDGDDPLAATVATLREPLL